MTELRISSPSRWLNPASGYLTGYSHTLNPYAGCTFACSYCYVRRMPVGLFRGKTWGDWVDVKQFDEKRFVTEWRRTLAKEPITTVFMSSSTDPYQPAEARYGVTRRILGVMAEHPPEFIMVQTRSPLVVRDTELLLRLGGRVRVSMTLETDLDEIRKKVTPHAPPLAARWKAMEKLAASGVPVQAAISPLLPHSKQFAERLARTVTLAVVDDFFRGDGSKGKRSAQLGMPALYRDIGYEEAYRPEYADQFYARLQKLMPGGAVKLSQEGFLPPAPQ